MPPYHCYHHTFCRYHPISPPLPIATGGGPPLSPPLDTPLNAFSINTVGLDPPSAHIVLL